MEGYEVPPKLQEERQELETTIAALRRKLKAIKVRARGMAWCVANSTALWQGATGKPCVIELNRARSYSRGHFCRDRFAWAFYYICLMMMPPPVAVAICAQGVRGLI